MDVRLALRLLVRRPGFAATALATLALGIGAPTAMFSVVHAVLLRPLPYPEPDRLVQFHVSSRTPAGPVSFDALPASEALDWAASSRTVDGLALYNDRALTLSTADGPFRLSGVSATPNLFGLLGVPPEVGRTFDPSGDPREVVLSHATWSRFFGGRHTAIGSLITLDGEPYRVLGVMPEAFRFPRAETAFWVPQAITAGGSRGMLLPAVARLAAAATVGSVAAEAEDRLGLRNWPTQPSLAVRTLHDQMTGGIGRILWILLAAVGFVGAVATTNLALLLMTRGASREREFAIRAALAAAVRTLVVALAPADVPGLGEATIDIDVLLFAAALTVGTSLIFGALSASRALESGSSQPVRITARPRRLAAARPPYRTRLNVLAAAELALTTVLLVAAGLLLRSFVGLVAADSGFDAGNALALQVHLPPARYPTPEARLAYQQRLLERLAATPGVHAVGLATTLPMRQPTGRFGFSASADILSTPDPRSMPVVDVHMVSPGFMEAMGLRLTEGRTFTAADASGAEPVMVISELFARQQFPDQSAAGRTLYSPSGNRRVIGVVADVRPADPGAEPKPDAYLPLSQNGDVLQWFASITAIARGDDAAAIGAAIRPAVLALDGQSPPFNVRRLEEDITRVTAAPRFAATIVGLFAAIALAMAFAGVYGVMAFAAQLRTHEIGVRLAMGATRARVIALMLRDGCVVVAAGLALGGGAALLLARTLTGVLYDVTPVDPLTSIAVAAALSAAGLIASFLPAYRATTVDPLEALREA